MEQVQGRVREKALLASPQNDLEVLPHRASQVLVSVELDASGLV